MRPYVVIGLRIGIVVRHLVEIVVIFADDVDVVSRRSNGVRGPSMLIPFAPFPLLLLDQARDVLLGEEHVALWRVLGQMPLDGSRLAQLMEPLHAAVPLARLILAVAIIRSCVVPWR